MKVVQGENKKKKKKKRKKKEKKEKKREKEKNLLFSGKVFNHTFSFRDSSVFLTTER